jgi:hypothetical protein
MTLGDMRQFGETEKKGNPEAPPASIARWTNRFHACFNCSSASNKPYFVTTFTHRFAFDDSIRLRPGELILDSRFMAWLRLEGMFPLN